MQETEHTKATQQTLIASRKREYGQEVSELRQKANAFFDKLIDLDVKEDEDRLKAIQICQKVKLQLEEFCKERLSKESLPNKELKLENFKVAVDLVRDCQEEGLIGTFGTVVALKNQSSFLIGTYTKGLKLYESGVQVYSGAFPLKYGPLRDMVFIPPLNCYFISYRNKTYRKDINNKPAYVCMDFRSGWREGACFRYSQLNQRLIINKDFEKISVVNPKTRKLEIVFKKTTIGKEIADFRIFGENQDRVISLTRDGFVLLYNLSSPYLRGVVSYNQINLIAERDEDCMSLAVCNKSSFAIAEIAQCDEKNICSRMVVFKITGDSLVKKAIIDQSHLQIAYKYALDCLGYAGKHILWLGLSKNKDGFVQVYDYDTESEGLRELQDKRVDHQEDWPAKLHRLDSDFYYNGDFGKVMKLSVTN